MGFMPRPGFAIARSTPNMCAPPRRIRLQISSRTCHSSRASPSGSISFSVIRKLGRM
jgi:hypothetical protein